MNVCVPVWGVGVGVVALRGRAIDMEGTHVCIFNEEAIRSVTIEKMTFELGLKREEEFSWQTV